MKSVFVVLAVASLYACGGGGGSTSPPPNNNPPLGNTPPPAGGISVTNDAYSPASKTVAVGTMVQWSWNTCTNDPYNYGGSTCAPHSVTFDDGTTSSPTQDQGSFSKTFTAPGTYTYHCAVHATMTGTITVQ